MAGDGLKVLADGARRLRESTDRAIVGLFGGNLFEVPQFLYRIDNYLMATALHPDAVLRLSEALCDLYLSSLEPWLSSVRPYIDVVVFGDDLGGQTGPMLSPAAYRRFYKPYHALMWSRTRELAPHVKIMLHSCGGIEPLLGDLIEAGLDAVNPVQTTACGMDAAELKQRYGDRLCLWGGGCDTQSMLPKGSPAAIRRHVGEQVRCLAPGGGFVFPQIHNIMADVPAENGLSMFDAVHNPTQQ